MVSENAKRGWRITGVFIDSVNVFTMSNAEYAEDEEGRPLHEVWSEKT